MGLVLSIKLGKICKSVVSIFPGKFPGKQILDGKFPVSREAENPGNLQTLSASVAVPFYILKRTKWQNMPKNLVKSLKVRTSYFLI